MSFMSYSSYNVYIVQNNAAVLLGLVIINYLTFTFNIWPLEYLLGTTLVVVLESFLSLACTNNIWSVSKVYILLYIDTVKLPYSRYLFVPGPATKIIWNCLRFKFFKLLGKMPIKSSNITPVTAHTHVSVENQFMLNFLTNGNNSNDTLNHIDSFATTPTRTNYDPRHLSNIIDHKKAKERKKGKAMKDYLAENPSAAQLARYGKLTESVPGVIPQLEFKSCIKPPPEPVRIQRTYPIFQQKSQDFTDKLVLNSKDTELLLKVYYESQQLRANSIRLNQLNEIANILNYQCAQPSVLDRPSLTEAQRLISLCRELCPENDLVSSLSIALTQMSAWDDQVRATFMNGRQKSLETVLRESFNNVQRITTSEDKKGIWCICRKRICRKPELGLMIECAICHEWYHSSCLKVPRVVVRSSNSYICPICLPTETTKRVSHRSRQPKLEEVTNLITTAEFLKFKPKDYDIIVDIHNYMQNYKCRVQAFCRSHTQLGLQDIPKTKFYLKTLIGLEVSLQDETEFLRSKIQSLVSITLPPINSYSKINNSVTSPDTSSSTNSSSRDYSTTFPTKRKLINTVELNSKRKQDQVVSLKPPKRIKLTI